jgi:hypothetical protein
VTLISADDLPRQGVAERLLHRMRQTPKRKPKRQDNGIYLDGVGLHQCGLPLATRDGSQSTLSMGDNNHAVVVTDDRIQVRTRVQTALSLSMQGLIGPPGRTHALAVGTNELGDAVFTGLMLVDDGRHDRVLLIFTRLRPAVV